VEIRESSQRDHTQAQKYLDNELETKNLLSLTEILRHSGVNGDSYTRKTRQRKDKTKENLSNEKEDDLPIKSASRR
jgi:hypothetical protein